MRPSILIACAVLAGATLPAAAQSLKPGLWEMRQKAGGNAAMDRQMAEMQEQMAALPPEQRKQMEAMMAARGMQMGNGAGGGMALKMCMTKEMVERDDVPGAKSDCKTTKRQRSGNTMTATMTCTNPPSTADTQVTFQGPEAFTSRTSITSTENGRTEKMTVEGTGKWLGADCGSIKPLK